MKVKVVVFYYHNQNQLSYRKWYFQKKRYSKLVCLLWNSFFFL